MRGEEQRLESIELRTPVHGMLTILIGNMIQDF